MPAPLVAAVLAFTAGRSVAANAASIRAGLAEAGRVGAAVLLTPECALIGYPGAAREDCAGIDWCQVADEEERLERDAQRAGVVLVLGTAAELPGDADSSERAASARRSRISNDALVLGATAAPVRYRKRALTPHDLLHFTPGPEQGACVVRIAGWQMGISICYELRFGALWAEQAAAGADGFLSLAHMAGGDPDPGTKAVVIPQLYSARAAEWATPLLLANTAAPDRWLASGHWDARGVRVGERSDGLLVTTLTPRTQLDPWYATVRAQALARLHPAAGAARMPSPA
jgi:predicted amidohydrolase